MKVTSSMVRSTDEFFLLVMVFWQFFLNFLFLFLNHTIIWCDNAAIFQWWCTTPVCRHTRCWWQPGCVGIVLSVTISPTITDEWCMMNVSPSIWPKMRGWVSFLGLTQSILTNVQMAFLNLKSNLVLFPAMTFKKHRTSICIFLWCFKTKKIVCNCVILVMSNNFECQKSQSFWPYFAAMT